MMDRRKGTGLVDRYAAVRAQCALSHISKTLCATLVNGLPHIAPEPGEWLVAQCIGRTRGRPYHPLRITYTLVQTDPGYPQVPSHCPVGRNIHIMRCIERNPANDDRVDCSESVCHEPPFA